MEGSIRHLHCQYRIIGGRGVVGASPAILDSLARTGLTDIYAEALNHVLGDAPTVYVLRRVSAPMLFAARAELSDPRLARRWGEQLAGAVLRQIQVAHDFGGNGAPGTRLAGSALRHTAARDSQFDNIITFTDQADYVAHFIADLLNGVAWDRWFYGAFAALRPLSTAAALQRVLLDNRPHLAAILSRLHRARVLDEMLALLGKQSCQAIWEEGLYPATPKDDEILRPVFAGALLLVDQLDLWAQTHPGSDAIFQEYLATNPAQPDWRDRRQLAIALCDVFSFLARRGYLLRWGAPPDAATLAPLLKHALAALDWTDIEWLRSELPALLRDAVAISAESSPGLAATSTELPTRPSEYGATPRQRELLAELAATLRENNLHLDLHATEVATNSLRLYAALVARAPRWTADVAALAMIRQTLIAWSYLRQSADLAETVRRLRRGDLASALRTVPETLRDSAAPACKFLVALGEPAHALIVRLAELDEKTARAGTALVVADGVETDCAGVALLLRAVSDARVPALVAEADFPAPGQLPPFAVLLLALGELWSGQSPAPDVDVGLSLLAGLPQPIKREQLRAAWSQTTTQDCLRFQSALLRVLVGQRLVQTETLRLFRIATEGGDDALIVGDETGSLWPLGCVLATKADVAQLIADLLQAWRDGGGNQPSLISADASLPEIAALPLDCQVMIVTGSASQNGAGSLHHVSRERLADALHAFGRGRLGAPDVDLTVALTSATLLRVWARWLRQFADSSVLYLLTNFIRRRGRIWLDDDTLWVELERQPLDIVIEMAGYTADLENVPWLGSRRVRFGMRGH